MPPKKTEETERDLVAAAQNQESPDSTGPDDFAQRVQKSQEEAKEFADKAAAEETPVVSATHQKSSIAAEAGEPYPEPPEDPEKLAKAAKKEAAKAKKEAQAAARKQAKERTAEEKIIPVDRKDAPFSDEAEEIELFYEAVLTQPQLTTLQIGDEVSRLDRSINEIGILINVHEPATAGLVDVEFPKSGVQTLNTNSLLFEGRESDRIASAEAYAKSEERGF